MGLRRSWRRFPLAAAALAGSSGNDAGNGAGRSGADRGGAGAGIPLRAPARFLNRQSIWFALRTTSASLIALYIAFLMQLDDPKWAAMTVWIVAQGSRSMAVSKGRNRIAGTLLGATVALMLVGAFSQEQALLLTLLAAWVGLCTSVATAWRNFRSYGAVLSGYTAAIVAMGALAAPEAAFEIAASRVLYIVLGIVVEGILSAVFSLDDPAADVRGRFRDYLHQAARVGGQALAREPNHAAVHKLIGDALDLETAIGYAAAASSEARASLGALRHGEAAVLQVLAATQSLRGESVGENQALRALMERTRALLGDVASVPVERGMHAAEEAEQLRRDVDMQLLADIDGNATHLIVLDRLRLLLAGLRDACDAFAALAQRRPRGRWRVGATPFAYHIDRTHAVQNGISTFVAVLASGAIWYATAWSNGGGFVAITSVVCALFATRPNPIKGAVGFLKGAMVASIAALIYNTVVMPALWGFFLLCCALGPVLLLTGVALRTPRFTAIATGFSIFFLDFVSPDNFRRVSDIGFINSALAVECGMAFSVVVFALLAFGGGLASRLRLWRAVRRDVGEMLAGRWRRSPDAWSSRTADRVKLIMTSSGDLSEAQRTDALTGLMLTWQLGATVLFVREHMAGTGAASPVFDRSGAPARIDAMLARLYEVPADRGQRLCLGLARRLRRQAGTEQNDDLRASLLRVSASLLSIGELLVRQPAELSMASKH